MGALLPMPQAPRIIAFAMASSGPLRRLIEGRHLAAEIDPIPRGVCAIAADSGPRARSPAKDFTADVLFCITLGPAATGARGPAERRRR